MAGVRAGIPRASFAQQCADSACHAQGPLSSEVVRGARRAVESVARSRSHIAQMLQFGRWYAK
eukprot:2059187-Amphidinium_carterae.1